MTDADVVLGRIDPDQFAGGRIKLDLAKAQNALVSEVGEKLELDATNSALGVPRWSMRIWPTQRGFTRLKAAR